MVRGEISLKNRAEFKPQLLLEEEPETTVTLGSVLFFTLAPLDTFFLNLFSVLLIIIIYFLLLHSIPSLLHTELRLYRCAWILFFLFFNLPTFYSLSVRVCAVTVDCVFDGAPIIRRGPLLLYPHQQCVYLKIKEEAKVAKKKTLIPSRILWLRRGRRGQSFRFVMMPTVSLYYRAASCFVAPFFCLISTSLSMVVYLWHCLRLYLGFFLSLIFSLSKTIYIYMYMHILCAYVKKKKWGLRERLRQSFLFIRFHLRIRK